MPGRSWVKEIKMEDGKWKKSDHNFKIKINPKTTTGNFKTPLAIFNQPPASLIQQPST
jgi:hypothetical protein